MFDDTARAISALSQGDPDRAASLIIEMGDDEFSDLTRLAASLAGMVAAEQAARDWGPLVARVTASMPPCTCPPRAARHDGDCPRRGLLGEAAPMRSGLLPQGLGEHRRQLYPSTGPAAFYACVTCRDPDGGLVPWPCQPAVDALAAARAGVGS